MKRRLSAFSLTVFALAAGAAGALARIGLYRFGTDSTGLLVRNHPLHILCWVLSIAVAAGLWAATRKDGVLAAPVDLTQGASLIGAGSILISMVTVGDFQDRLALARMILGLAAAVALVYAGWRHQQGSRAGVYPFALLCIFFAVHLVCCYRVWSGNPQLADYTWQLFAVVCLILASYQKCALQAGAGNPRAHLLLCLLAGYFCILAAWGSGWGLLYFGCGIYVACTATDKAEE